MMKKILLLLVSVCVSWTASAFDFEQIQIHGFASQGYLQSDHYKYIDADTENGTLEFNEFGLSVLSQMNDSTRLGLQLLMWDLGDFGNDEVTLNWAFADYRYRNWLGFRAGKMKSPIGFYNQVRDIDAARTSVLLPSSLYNEDYREIQSALKGLSLYGAFPWGVEYQLQYGLPTFNPEGSVAKGIEQNFQAETESLHVDNDAFIGNLIWNTPIEGVTVGGVLVKNFSWTHELSVGDVSFENEQYVLSVEFLYDKLTCAAEYKQRSTEFRFNGNLLDDPTGEGYYGLLSYQVTDWIELGTYYAVEYQDKDDKDGDRYVQQGQPKANAWLKDWALSVRFDVNEYWIIKLEGHWMNGLHGVSDYGDDPSEDWFLAAAKVTFSF